jgi:hypothetical protein
MPSVVSFLHFGSLFCYLLYDFEFLARGFGTSSMDSLTDENMSIFMKIDKSGVVQFYRFTKNRSVKFEI